MRHLYVHYEAQLVSTIEEDGDGVLTMYYDHDWQRAPAAFPLSLALPLGEPVHRGRPVQAFFENLLPEGDQRRRIETIAHLPAGDDVAFLERFGEDCAGALSISAHLQSAMPERKAPMAETAIDLVKVEEAIREGKSVQSALNIGHQLPPFSLAGAQAKFPCVLRDGALYLPRRSHPTTHIVKLPIRAGDKLLDSVANEFLSMSLAKLCRLPVPKVEMVGRDVPLFAIERFDRKLIAGKVYRQHTQDFCQALGLPSREKYESHGGPSLQDCYQLVKREAANKAHDLLLILDWTAFNLALGNNDSHAKNLSWIFSNQTQQLAPFYDLVCTAIYPQYHASFAFKIGDTSTWKKINHAEMQRLERNLGLSKGFARERFLRVFATLEGVLAQQAADADATAFDIRKTLRKITAEIDKRISTLRSAWTL